jgi:hypothetical protein
MQKWEYTWFVCEEESFATEKEKLKTLDGMNGSGYMEHLGANGWELVSAVVIPQEFIGGVVGYRGETDYVRYLFKRPIE